MKFKLGKMVWIFMDRLDAFVYALHHICYSQIAHILHPFTLLNHFRKMRLISCVFYSVTCCFKGFSDSIRRHLKLVSIRTFKPFLPVETMQAVYKNAK